MKASKKPVNVQTKSQRKNSKTAQWVTFLVLFSFVTGSVIIGGLSFRSGRQAATPSTAAPASPPAGGEDPVRRWRQVVKDNPGDPFALRSLARALAGEGNYPEARKEALAALKLSPSDVLNFELLGGISAKSGNMSQAVIYLKKAAAETPKDPILLFNLAQAYSSLTEYPQAEIYYRKVLKIKPMSLEGLRSRLILMNDYLYEKKYRAAEEQAEALYSVLPKNPQLLERIGEIYENEGRLSKAVSYYEKAAKLNPADIPLLTHLAQACKTLGKTREAKYLLERALKQAGQNKGAPEREKIRKALQGLH